MKTLPLVSIIAVIGMSLTFLVFLYQYQQNCRAEGGSLVEPLTCDKTNYELMTELFHKKYTVTGGWVADGVNGATTELTSTDPDGNSITLLLKANRNGPYYAEIVCKHKDSKITQTITENILDYLQNQNCFVPVLVDSDSFSLNKINQSELVFVQKEEGDYNSIYSPTMKDVNYINDDSIEITFAKTQFTDYIPNDFEFTKIAQKGDTFITLCKESNKGTAYLIILRLASINSTFVSFDHYETDLPEDIECKYPEIIEQSFDITWKH